MQKLGSRLLDFRNFLRNWQQIVRLSMDFDPQLWSPKSQIGLEQLLNVADGDLVEEYLISRPEFMSNPSILRTIVQHTCRTSLLLSSMALDRYH